MEKSSDKRRKYIKGLLASVLVFACSASFNLFSLPPSWAYMWSLRFVPQQETLFTATDNAFSVDIKNVTPDNIQISVNSLPDNVSFVSSKKETVMVALEEGGMTSGTRLTLWMRFNKTGTYKINPIDLTVEGGFYRIPVESVVVLQNPRFITPELKVTFHEEKFDLNKYTRKGFSATTNDHIRFTISARYARSINDVIWDIPEDSIFKETKRYDFVSSKDATNVSMEFRPVVTFDWHPLKNGRKLLPNIYINCTSFNGSDTEIKCPRYVFNVQTGILEKDDNEKKYVNTFPYAYYEEDNSTDNNKSFTYTKDQIQKLYELHCKERNSLPVFSNAYIDRKKFEKELSLPSSEREPSVLLFKCLLGFFVIFLAATIICFARKRYSLAIFFSCFLFFFGVFSGINGIKISSITGIYEGGEMSPIPEKNILSTVTIQEGSVVYIIRTVGDWMYIRCNNTYGWVLAENIKVIK